MDPAMMAMLAQRLGASGSGGPNNQSASDSQSADPLISMLMNQMASSTSESEQLDRTAKLERQLEVAKRRIGMLRASMATAEEMVGFIAATFGACTECWGLNRLCQHCHGVGGPGWRQPNVDDLLEWIEPALHRAGLRVRRSPPPHTDVDSRTRVRTPPTVDNAG